MDWYNLFKSVVQIVIEYFNMSFTFRGHKITVATVFIFVGLVSLVMMIFRRLSE